MKPPKPTLKSTGMWNAIINYGVPTLGIVGTLILLLIAWLAR